MKKVKNIAILTSGGDAPGMNSCIYSVFQTCALNGINLYGVRRGYSGLIEGDIVKLKYDDVRDINNLGGSFLGTSRCKEFETPEGRQSAMQNLQKQKIDCLIAIGGDGTFTGLIEFAKIYPNVIGIPGTIDNDMGYTERTIGFDTAVNNAVDAIDIIKQTMKANRRISVIETMGRHCGMIALHSATAGNASIVVTSERNKTEQEIKELVVKQLKRGNPAPTIVIAEKLLDVKKLAENLEKELGVEARGIVLGYIQRGGSPTVSDRITAMRFAVESVHSALNQQFGFVLGIRANKIIREPLNSFKSYQPYFDAELFDEFCARNKI